MSRFSPGPVLADEKLARFLFHPMHFGKKGDLKPSVFSHVHVQGCSVQRDSIATEKEITTFVRDFLNGKADRKWQGVLTGNCLDVRSILAGQTKLRAVCVYDTAEPKNPAHGELFQTKNFVDDGDLNELRNYLFKAFGEGAVISPQDYRDGVILKNVTGDN